MNFDRLFHACNYLSTDQSTNVKYRHEENSVTNCRPIRQRKRNSQLCFRMRLRNFFNDRFGLDKSMKTIFLIDMRSILYEHMYLGSCLGGRGRK